MTARPRIDTAERLRRIIVRHHLGRTAPDVVAATRGVLALHSSDPATPFLACWARIPGTAVADLEHALYADRALWRLHTVRRTLWVVPVEEGPTWLGAATTALAASDWRRLIGFTAQSPLPPAVLADPRAWLDGLAARALDVLHAADQPLTTRDLGEMIPELTTKIVVGSGRWTQEQSVSSRLLYVLAMEGRIVRAQPLGSWRASQYRWAPAPEWFQQPADALAARPEATARPGLLRRYLQAFGPVTTDDVRWWSGWTKARTVSALGELRAVAVDLDGGGEGWVLAEDVEPTPAPGEGQVTLLPGLDPTPMGWKERSWYLGEHTTFGGPLFDRNGNIGPTILLDGRAVGAWSQRPDGEVVTGLLEDVGAEAQQRIEAEAAALQAWLTPDHVVVPRFPTPLETALRKG